MTNRERFHAAMAFEPTDRPCHIEHGFWDETVARWHGEGLTKEIHQAGLEPLGGPRPSVFDYFQVTRLCYLLRNQYYIPAFTPEVIEENEQFAIVRDELGVTYKKSKLGASLPQCLDYPIKEARDYDALRERLAPKVSQRYGQEWETLARLVRQQQDMLVSTHMNGFFAHPREVMGVEAMLVMFYDDPDLMHRIIDDRCDFYIQVYEKAIRDTKPDFAFIWEDMCFKNGPLVSPAIFREFMLPAYKKLTGWLREMGIKNIIVDSDGDIRALIPLWLEGGVTGLLPFEVKAGLDIVEIGKQYPKLQIIGGIDKHALERTPKDINRELERVLPAMMKRGGYAVSLDHWVQPEIPLKNYQYYVERVRSFKT